MIEKGYYWVRSKTEPDYLPVMEFLPPYWRRHGTDEDYTESEFQNEFEVVARAMPPENQGRSIRGIGNIDYVAFSADYGYVFSWRSLGSSGAMSFTVKKATCDEGVWLLNCEDGNGLQFDSRGATHAEAMFWAAGMAMGVITDVNRDAFADEVREVFVRPT